MAKVKVKHLKLIITLNPMSKVPKLVPHWQEELYLAKFGEENVQVLDEVLVERDALPDAADELARLREEFGIHPEERQAFVDMVFGRGRGGVSKLDAMMNDRPKPKRSRQAKPEGEDGEGEGEGESDTAGGDPLAK